LGLKRRTPQPLQMAGNSSSKLTVAQDGEKTESASPSGVSAIAEVIAAASTAAWTSMACCASGSRGSPYPEGLLRDLWYGAPAASPEAEMEEPQTPVHVTVASSSGSTRTPTSSPEQQVGLRKQGPLGEPAAPLPSHDSMAEDSSSSSDSSEEEQRPEEAASRFRGRNPFSAPAPTEEQEEEEEEAGPPMGHTWTSPAQLSGPRARLERSRSLVEQHRSEDVLAERQAQRGSDGEAPQVWVNMDRKSRSRSLSAGPRPAAAAAGPQQCRTLAEQQLLSEARQKRTSAWCLHRQVKSLAVKSRLRYSSAPGGGYPGGCPQAPPPAACAAAAVQQQPPRASRPVAAGTGSRVATRRLVNKEAQDFTTFFANVKTLDDHEDMDDRFCFVRPVRSHTVDDGDLCCQHTPAV